MSIYIIRHGRTAANRDGLLLARADPPLDAEGEAQALRLRDWFASEGIVFDRVISSPLRRALRTAEIACGGRNVIETDDRLLEMDAGPFEGCPLKDLPEELTEFFRDFIRNAPPEGMETLDSVERRTGELLDGLEYVPGGNILISTHAIAMKGALEHLTPGSGGSYWMRYIPNCSAYRAEQDGNGIGVPAEVFSPEWKET